MKSLEVPESLREEHELFMNELKSDSRNSDRTGAALKELLRLLEPHVATENELVLPLLGALARLASDEPLDNPGTITNFYGRYAARYQSMFAEHSPIRRAIRKARASAKEEGHEQVVDMLDALAHHSRVEEQVLYPAALIVGRAAPLLFARPTGRVKKNDAGNNDRSTTVRKETSPVMPAGNHDATGGAPYFTLDYDEPVSQVRKELTARHEEIEEILAEVEDMAERGKPRVAASLLNAASPLILRTAVEEEARIMRVVMQKNSSRAQRSISVEREHKYLVDFLKNQLPNLGTKPKGEARESILAFVRLMRDHLSEEEEIPFSIAAASTK